jgi:hypothetical protein
MSGKKGSAETGEYLGSALTGVQVHPLAAGDIVHVPEEREIELIQIKSLGIAR